MAEKTFKIFIEAGHGGSDPGAVKYVKESEQNIKVVNYAADCLTKNYVCSVKKDISANSLMKICGDANKWDADLFISVHFNAGRGDGFEVFVYSKANEAIGKAIEKQVKAIGQNSRGVKIDPELIVLNSTNMKAALVECAFVDNWKDIQDWDEDHELKKMGEAIAKGVADYLDLPKKKSTSTAKAEKKKPAKKEPAKQTKPSAKVTFIKAVQKACGAEVDGIAGPETLSKTVTVSASINRKHKVVKAIQTYLNHLGYNCGTVDGIAGPKFTAAVKRYQAAKGCVCDGEITAGAKTWKKLLGL